MGKLKDYFPRLREVRVAVVGDFCLDAYWLADMTRSELSRETPRFALPVAEERYSPGAAGNVAANVRALGPETVAVGVLGRDWRGEVLLEELRRRGVDTQALPRAEGWLTPAYIKPVRRGYETEQEDSRIDFANAEPLGGALEDELLSRLRSLKEKADGVCVQDQLACGVVTKRVRKAVGEAGPHVVADSRSCAGEYRGVAVKPNELEAASALGRNAETAPEELARALAEKVGGRVFLTVGKRGCLVCEAGSDATLVEGFPQDGPVDIVGAGDTFLAALVSFLACGAPPEEAAAFANLAASVTVKKLGTTGTCTPEELLARADAVGFSG